MEHLRAVVDRLHGQRVLVIGDVMLDEYVRGDVARISPEAPVPVLEVRELGPSDVRLGGAANAANNIQALGGHATLIGLVGADATADVVQRQLDAHSIGRRLVTDPSRPTSRKSRLVAGQQQIVRVDYERRAPVAGGIAEELKRAIAATVAECHAVVLSDYAKGVITAEIAQHAITCARAAAIPVIVDPKQRDFAAYRGATVVTPNLHELEAAAPHDPGGFTVDGAVAQLLPALAGAALLVTRSADGMTLFRAGAAPIHARALAKEVFDVTGAGDTVVATLALALAARVSFPHAVELASVAAAVSVSKRGTATVTPGELAAELGSG